MLLVWSDYTDWYHKVHLHKHFVYNWLITQLHATLRSLNIFLYFNKKAEQAGAELGQAQLKLELELSFTWFKFCCIQFIDKNTTDYFDCH